MGKILITGATGNTGSRLTQILAKQGSGVKAAVHNKAKAKVDPGVEVVEMHLEDAKSVDAAFAGIEKAYLVSPFVENHDKVSRVMVDAARKAGVKHIVKLSPLVPTLLTQSPRADGTAAWR